MKKILPVFIILAALTANANDDGGRLRVDCRFYDEDDTRFCYASAIYNVEGQAIFNIRYGVGCNYETIFNDRGTSSPESTLFDGIRPKTAATPRVEIIPQGALKNPGTYKAKLEIDAGKIRNGQCFVTRFHGAEPDLNAE